MSQSSTARPRQGRGIAVALVIIGALALVLFLRRTKAPAEPSASAETFAPLGAPSVVGPLSPREKAAALASAAPSASIETPGPDMSRDAFNKRKADMTREALKTVDDRINYPLWSGKLTENMQYKPPVPAHASMPGNGGANPTLELYTEKLYYYSLTDPIKVIAVAHRDSGVGRFDVITGTTVGGIRPRPQLDLSFEEQSDHTYVATLNIPKDVAAKNRGDWGVTVDCMIDGEHRVLTTQFYLMGANAEVVGPYRAALENGSLVVYATVRVDNKARLHLKGELWTPQGQPISYAWVRNDDAEPGRLEMKLTFYGKTIRDSGHDGPYVVKNLLLTEFDPNNDRIVNDPVDPALVTGPIRKDQLTDAPINGDNAMLNEKKQILQAELDKAQKNGFDPQHPDPPPPTKSPKDGPPPQ